MGLDPAQNKIVELLILQEQKISELYALFARQFPQQEAFWENLSIEEKKHAQWLEKLFEAAKSEKIIFNQKKITIHTLSAFIKRLDDILSKAKRGEFTLTSALHCAVDYESSLIEKNIFSHFDSPHEKIDEILKKIQSETENHVESIKKVQIYVKGINQ